MRKKPLEFDIQFQRNKNIHYRKNKDNSNFTRGIVMNIALEIKLDILSWSNDTSNFAIVDITQKMLLVIDREKT